VARVEAGRTQADVAEQAGLSVRVVQQDRHLAGAVARPGGLVVQTLAYTGLRLGEVAALRVSLLDSRADGAMLRNR
jgi:integrase